MIRRAATGLTKEPSARRSPILALAAVLAVSTAFSCRSRQTESSGSGRSEEEALRARIAELSARAQLYSAEISLAKNPNPYLAVDFANRKIDLKVQGHSLRSFPIAKFKRVRGTSSPVDIWMEIEAKPFQSQVRARVVPGSGEATTSSVAVKDPWGPKRMPADYDLICKGDQALEVRSLLSEQSGYRLTRWIVGGYRQTRDWVRSTLGFGKSTYLASIEIWMSEDDSRLLFWSLPKQFGILLLNAP